MSIILFYNYLIIIFLFFSNCSKNKGITITAVGDIYFTNTELIKNLPINLKGDIVIGNLEGVIDSNFNKNDIDENIMSMPVDILDALKNKGFNAFNLANNHSLDKGWDNYYFSKQKINDTGISVCGIDDDGFIYKNEEGKTIRFVGFSFNTPNNIINIDKVSSKIKSFKEDIIIVSAHMGTEDETAYQINGGMEYYMQEPRGDVKKFSHACIDAGADMVIGHSPHVVREIELYKNKIIIYSLGNFVFSHPRFTSVNKLPSISFQIKLNEKGDFIKAKAVSYLIVNGIPHNDKKSTAFALLKNFNSNKALDFRRNLISNQSYLKIRRK